MNDFLVVVFWLIVAVGIAAPVIYFGIPIGQRGAKLSPGRSIAVALIATVFAGMTGAIGAFVPVIGFLLAPLTWIGVVGWLTAARWLTAGSVAVLSWATTLVVMRVVELFL